MPRDTASTSGNMSSVTDHPILARLRADNETYYAGTTNIISMAEYHSTHRTGNQLIVKNQDVVPTEVRDLFSPSLNVYLTWLQFIMTGVFQIEPREFWFMPDAGYKPSNSDNITFATTKATCLLGPVKRDKDFAFSLRDYDQITTNILGLQKLMPKQKGEVERTSALTEFTAGGSQLFIKLSHTLFKASIYVCAYLVLAYFARRTSKRSIKRVMVIMKQTENLVRTASSNSSH
jgi:hypothetical protein